MHSRAATTSFLATFVVERHDILNIAISVFSLSHTSKLAALWFSLCSYFRGFFLAVFALRFSFEIFAISLWSELFSHSSIEWYTSIIVFCSIYIFIIWYFAIWLHFARDFFSRYWQCRGPIDTEECFVWCERHFYCSRGYTATFAIYGRGFLMGFFALWWKSIDILMFW